MAVALLLTWMIPVSSSAASTVSVASASDVLGSGEKMFAGDNRMSPNGQYSFIMQGDGNLVLYALPRSLWDTATDRNAGAYVAMQTDGNLVVYSATGTALWDTATDGNPGAYLQVQDDNNIIIRDRFGVVIWAANVAPNRFVDSGQALEPNWWIQSNSRKFQLIMQGDGNLVLYRLPEMIPIWDTATPGNPGARTEMQRDGNLVVFGAQRTVLWASNTPNNWGSYLELQDDGNLVIFAIDRRVVWASGTDGGGGTLATKIKATALSELGNNDHNREIGGEDCNFYSSQLGVGSKCRNGAWRARPWCADFGRWVWGQSSASTRYLSGEAGSFYTYGDKNHTWKPGYSSVQARVGDAVVYNLNTSVKPPQASHVGLVTEVLADGRITVVSGNYSDRVASTTFAPSSRSGISGYSSPVPS